MAFIGWRLDEEIVINPRNRDIEREIVVIEMAKIMIETRRC